MIISGAAIYFIIGLSLAVIVARKMHSAEGDRTELWIGLVAIIAGALWPIEAVVIACQLFARLTKPKESKS